MAERQFAAGGPVIKKDSERLEVLLIKDSYGRWTWPKGHIESGETPEQAALREVSEETGLKEIEIEKELGRQEYRFRLEGKLVFKTVHVFLLKASPGESLNMQVSEVRDARWFTPEEASRKIEYEGSRALLEKGIALFRKKYIQT